MNYSIKEMEVKQRKLKILIPIELFLGRIIN